MSPLLWEPCKNHGDVEYRTRSLKLTTDCVSFGHAGVARCLPAPGTSARPSISSLASTMLEKRVGFAGGGAGGRERVSFGLPSAVSDELYSSCCISEGGNSPSILRVGSSFSKGGKEGWADLGFLLLPSFGYLGSSRFQSKSQSSAAT